MKQRYTNPGQPKSAVTGAASAFAQAKFMEGFALHQNGQLARAQDCYQQVLGCNPDILMRCICWG